MSFMFYYGKFITSLDVSNWDTSNVTTMDYMFYEVGQSADIDVSNWDTGSVTTMYCMFSSSSILNLNVSNWDVSNVTNMQYMFYGVSCPNLDLTKWDTGNVTDMSYMFCYAHIENLDLTNWDTSNVTNMSKMFMHSSSLINLDLSNWDTSNVTDMGNMFFYASFLRSLDLTNWDTSNVTYMNSMFSNSISLDTLILGKKSVLNSETYLEEKNDSIYTGAWILQNGTNRYDSSADLVTNYDGTYPGTYVRERTDQNIEVTGIELLPTTLSLTVGQEQLLQTKISPIDATNQTVSYTSSDPSIATVDALGKVTAIKAGTATITAMTEDGGLTATTQVTVKNPSLVFPDIFYLGIDQYVTGSVDPSLNARKAQLLVNGLVVNTVNLFSDGSFELASHGAITQSTDVVEVIVLDRKNGVLDQETVTIKEKSYSLTVHPYTLYSGAVTGVADYYHSHVSLFVNGELVVNQLLSLTREFSLDASDWIEYMDDEVEVVGYRYGVEVTRQVVTIELPTIKTTLNDYKVGDVYVTGQVTGEQAKQVVLYVNRRRQQVLPINADGTFQLLGLAIMSPLDTVQVAVLNEAGMELQRYAVNVSF